MRELDILRVSALLHDIGKIECWADGKYWSEHIYYTYRFLRDLLGEEIAGTSMRHHMGRSYLEEVFPCSMMEKIICFADNLASGADRREEPAGFSSKPKFPILLSHVLSEGDVIREEFSPSELAYISVELQDKIKEPCMKFSSNSTSAYFRIFEILSESRLRLVPADTRSPVNDVSLWDHLKLTAAFSTCIYLDGGFRSFNPEDYTFALVSGDADRISNFINVSVRIRDLHARSELIKEATNKASNAISEILGPECVLYSGGGGFLAVSPVSKASEVESAAKKAFEEAANGLVTMTTSRVEADGEEIRDHFGEVWWRAQRSMAIMKSRREAPELKPIDEGVDFCDVCNLKPATHIDRQKILRVDATARPERLCDDCWRLRRSAVNLRVELEDLGQSGYVGLLKADGDNIGALLGGERFSELGKANTPSRLSTLSWLINEICEEKFAGIIEDFGGKCIYSGGDDLMALLPGERSFDATRSVYEEFRRSMNYKCTMSAGLVIFRKELPLYISLEAASILLSRAKDAGKDRIAFMFIGSSGISSSDIWKIKPLRWNELNVLMDIVDFMRQSGVSVSHYRRVAELVMGHPEMADAYVKYLMGRGIIGWREGMRILGYIGSGLLRQAFMVYNLLERRVGGE